MSLFLFNYQHRLHLDKFKNRCHSLYLGIKHTEALPLLYYSFFVARRLVICTIIVFMADWPAF